MPVFLSPHHDDVCFSLSAAARSGGGHLVNVFTQSEYVEIPLPTFRDREEKIRYVTQLRAEEDLRFARTCNLQRHDLSLEEPSLFGVGSRDLSNLHPEVERVGGVLIDLVLGIADDAGDGRRALYCPVGIGGHRNHISVLLAVLAALPRLRSVYDLYFYEDLHYASRLSVRNQGLARFFRLMHGERLTRLATPLSPESMTEKMVLVGRYVSQHGRPPDPASFTPAALSPVGPHEAVWALGPADA